MPQCIRCRKEINDTPFCPLCGAKQERTIHKKKRGNGFGTAYKTPGASTWTARITVGFVMNKDGKLVQKYRTKSGFKTQTAALQYCQKMKDSRSIKPAAPTLSHYWELFSADELYELSSNRQGIYKKAWARLKPLHMLPVDTITVSHLRSAVSAATHTYDTAKALKTLLKHLFRLAEADGYASKTLPDHIILPKQEEHAREAFTEDEQKALWALYESGDKRAAVPLIMIHTGMMPGEFKQLTKDKIDFEQQQIIGAGLKTKVRKESPIYIPDVIIPLLRELCESSTSAKGYVLIHNDVTFHDDYYGALAAANVRPLTPYCCRHTTATALAISRNIAPQTIQKVMRWSTSKMLDRYAHPSDADAMTAANTIKQPQK